MTESMKEWIKECKELRKQNEILVTHILELQKTNGSLTDRVNELEKKLEETKSYRCKNHYVVLDKGYAVACYKVYDCKSCCRFKE